MTVEAQVVQYRRAFVDQFETRVSMLRNACTKESMSSGQQVKFLVAGSGSDTAVTRGVNGQIPYGNPTNTQKTVTLTEKHAPYELTGFNIFASQGDQKAIMRQAAMSVINRDIDLTILSVLANATINTTAATASVDLVETARAYLGNQSVPIEEEENMFAVVSPAFMKYLRQTTEFSSADYVDMKTYAGPTRKMLRWAGINWMVSSLISGLAGSAELCYLFHRSAIGYAVNVGEDSIHIGYDEKQDTSWSRATIYHGGVVLQNTGIVQMIHNGSSSNLS